MKRIFLLFAIACFSINVQAQIDRSTGKSTPIKGFGKSLETSDSSLLDFPRNHSLSKKNGLFKHTRKLVDPSEKEEKPLKMTTDNGLMKFETKFNPSYLNDNEIREEHGNDAYLGDYKTGGASVDLMFRDHEFVDGDKVRILVNDKVVHNSITLTGRLQGILITLETGFNKIEIVALNQGTSGPNTAEFKLYDDQGKLLTSNYWHLLTGTKGTMIVVKN